MSGYSFILLLFLCGCIGRRMFCLNFSNSSQISHSVMAVAPILPCPSIVIMFLSSFIGILFLIKWLGRYSSPYPPTCATRFPCLGLSSGRWFVGSANNAFPLYSGRFSLTCPRTVLTRLHVYGSPSVTSSYLTHLWIFALHSAHTTKVFLCI